MILEYQFASSVSQNINSIFDNYSSFQIITYNYCNWTPPLQIKQNYPSLFPHTVLCSQIFNKKI